MDVYFNYFASTDDDSRKKITKIALQKYQGDFHKAIEDFLAPQFKSLSLASIILTLKTEDAKKSIFEDITRFLKSH